MKNRITYNNIMAVHPGGFIESFLEDMKMSVEELAEQSKVDIQILKQLINADIDINEEIAKKLYPVTGFHPDLILNLQESYYDDLQKINRLKDKVDSKLFSTAMYVLNNFDRITTTKLQKLVYYCQAWSLVIIAEPLFDEDFQAWVNGPVCPKLYSFHKGEFDISIDDFRDIEPPPLTDEEKQVIDFVLYKYGKMKPSELIKQTHKENPWLEARGNTPQGVKSKEIISKEEMQDFYAGFIDDYFDYLEKTSQKP